MKAARLKPALALALVLGVLACYAQILNHGFIDLDDPLYVIENEHVNTGLGLDNIVWAFTRTHSANWHPLTWLAHMGVVEVFGMKAGAQHALGLGLHTLNTVLLFLVLARLTASPLASAMVAAIFALHPLHVESVAWVSELKDTLAGFFWLTVIWAHAGYARAPSWRRYALVALLFALGLMAKPMLVSLPAVLLLLDFWPLERAGGRLTDRSTWLLVLEKLPLAGLAVASAVVTVLAQGEWGVVNGQALGPRLENALVAYAMYIYKAVVPLGLGVFYPFPEVYPAWKPILAGLGLVMISLAALVAARKKFLAPAVGWLWFLGSLIPVIGLVQVGRQAYADRYTYLPMIGLAIMAVWVARGLIRRFAPNPKAVWAASLIVLALFMGLTIRQAGFWKDTLTLFTHTARVTQNNHMALNLVGETLLEAGQPDQALAWLEEAIAADETDAGSVNLMGSALAMTGQKDKAAAFFRRAVAMEPASPMLNLNYANLLFETRRHAQAERYYARALEIEPENAEAWYFRGLNLAAGHRLAEAITALGRARALEPGNPRYVKALERLGGG